MKIIELSDVNYDILQKELRELKEWASTVPDNILFAGTEMDHVLRSLRHICTMLKVPTAQVALYDFDGTFVIREQWRIPQNLTSELRPSDMALSPDFHRINNGAVLILPNDPFDQSYLFNANV